MMKSLFLLFDLHTAKSPDLPYWKYNEFDLDKLSDDECMTEFRFLKDHIYTLVDAMKIPDSKKFYNGLTVDRVEAFCIFLKRYEYPCRYLDIMPRLCRPVPQLCMVSNAVMNFLYNQWNYLLSTFDQPSLTISKDFVMQCFRRVVLWKIALASLMGRFVLFVNPEKIKGFSTMVTREFMR